MQCIDDTHTRCSGRRILRLRFGATTEDLHLLAATATALAAPAGVMLDPTGTGTVIATNVTKKEIEIGKIEIEEGGAGAQPAERARALREDGMTGRETEPELLLRLRRMRRRMMTGREPRPMIIERNQALSGFLEKK